MTTKTLVVYRWLPAVVLLFVTTALGLGAADVGPRERLSGFPGPKPGEVFREYVWTKAGEGGFLRVGGRLGYGGGPVVWPHDFDLIHAARAEVVLEKLLCHDGTRGLALSVNDREWIAVPEPAGVAEPPWDYQHHVYPVVPVPLDQLQAGTENQFRLRVSDEHPWKWPQNLLYGVHVRIYYDAAKKSHLTGRLLTPKPGTALGTKVDLAAEAASPDGSIRQVDFLGQYEGVNLEGDGEYSQWHGHHVKGKWKNHIGTVTASPWMLTWDTSWVPDQPHSFRLAARITDESGLTYFTDAVEGLTFQRPGLAVELCKPYDVPKKWVTREDEMAEKFCVTGDLRNAVAAQLVWTSWSPGYMDGLYLNGQRIFDREGPRYAYCVHRVPLQDLMALKAGENTLKTGLTPKRDGEMVHGMEVNWPGIMVLIQYRK